MTQTTIEWTDKTWNPVRGCSIVSPGCINCYAMKQAHRFSGSGKPYHGLTKLTKAGPQWTGRIREVVPALNEPLWWRKPSRVFVNSMSDLFHDGVSDEYILNVFTVMAVARQHTFQVLTKRPERMRALLSRWRADDIYTYWYDYSDGPREIEAWPLSNVWLGVSVENQKYADERIPLLLQTPAAVRFISAEPLLGPVKLCRCCAETGFGGSRVHGVLCPLGTAGLNWVIVGGESGPGARPFDIAWARSIVKQCKAAGVPVFVKQLGSKPEQPQKCGDCDPCLAGADCYQQYRILMDLDDRKGGDMAEWPADLRVRQFPRA